MLAVLLNAACAWFMAGVIAVIQVVHYPLFARVGEAGYAAYQADHMRLITPVVMPPMLLELGAAIWLVWQRPAGVPAWAAWLGLALVGVVWASTALLQVPAHHALTAAFDPDTHARLVATNWLRTAAWLARSALFAWLLWTLLRPAP